MTQRDEILRHVIGRTTSRVRLETVVSMGHRRRLDIVTAEGAATLFFDQGLGSWDAVDDPAFDSNASIADQIVATEAPMSVANKPEGRSEEHTSELQSLMRISYAVFCLKKKKT